MQSDVVKRAREAAGLNRSQLAARAGVPASTVSRIESGQTDPTLGMVDRLLRAAGYSLDMGMVRASDPLVTLAARNILTGQEFEQLAEDNGVRAGQIFKSFRALGYTDDNKQLIVSGRELARHAGQRSQIEYRLGARFYESGFGWIAAASRLDVTKKGWASTGARAAERLGAKPKGNEPSIFYVEDIALAERLIGAKPVASDGRYDLALLPFDGSETESWRDANGYWWTEPMQTVVDCYGLGGVAEGMANQIADEWDRIGGELKHD